VGPRAFTTGEIDLFAGDNMYTINAVNQVHYTKTILYCSGCSLFCTAEAPRVRIPVGAKMAPFFSFFKFFLLFLVI
jgi:hypothetical protein